MGFQLLPFHRSMCTLLPWLPTAQPSDTDSISTSSSKLGDGRDPATLTLRQKKPHAGVGVTLGVGVEVGKGVLVLVAEGVSGP
jgi:hypothetical protein